VTVLNLSRATLIRVCMGAVLIAALMAPALWNGYALLQFDTGGYLARWYEDHLVPSRSTVFGNYLHVGETTNFWINLFLQSAATVWIIGLTLKHLGLDRIWQTAAVILTLCVFTTLPFLTSVLLADIFAGLSILALYLIIIHGRALSRWQTVALIAFAAFSAATHSITLALMLALCAAGWVALPFLRNPFLTDGLSKASLAIVAGTIALVLANYHSTGQVTWTPGGTGIAFGRMLQDGIVTRYLNDHCDDTELKLCPYRDRLPRTADQFLWGDDSVFNELGRFDGLGDEMQTIASNALVEYPGLQVKTVLAALIRQLALVASGEGVHDKIGHTYAIFDRYLPNEATAMRRARQQRGELSFTALNMIHVPIALASAALLAIVVLRGLWLRQFDDVTIFAGIVLLVIIANALISGAIAGPHDRYGARLAWLGTFAVLVLSLRRWLPVPQGEFAYGRRVRNASTPSL
jgi:hypothetical protein